MPFSENHSQLPEDEIKRDLFEISSLDQKQRKVVEEILEKHKGSGPLKTYEFEEALEELKKKRVELGLSEIDIENIENYFLGKN